MSIHPDYASAILDGDKRVEFRKRRLAPDVVTVLIYATAPVQRLVGYFTIDDVVEGSPAEVWKNLHHVGGISAENFTRYYQDAASAVAIRVATVCRFARPVALSELSSSPAVPQSFNYVDQAVLDEAVGRSGSSRPVHARLRKLLIGLRRRTGSNAPAHRAS